MNMQYRQGDVLLRRIDAFDAPALRKVSPSRGRLVLARGEATGHAHAVEASRAELYRGRSGRFFLRLAGATVLEHEEHAPIELPAGCYEVIRQREYRPGRIRRVAD